MEALLYFAVWAGLFFLMMRFGCGSHIMGHERGGHAAREQNGHWAPPETDTDPVCGKRVQTNTAKSALYRGAVYFFCSNEHRDAFESDPERYASSQLGGQARPMEHHHG